MYEPCDFNKYEISKATLNKIKAFNRIKLG